MDLRIIPNLSVDCVIFGFNTNSLSVLLIERKLKKSGSDVTVVDDYVLTGYHVFKDETLDQSAARVLKELTGLDDIYKKQFKTFGDPDRLVRKKDKIWATDQDFNARTITVAYYFLLPTHQISVQNSKFKAQWFPVNKLPELGFDHEQIIKEAYEDLKLKVVNEPIIFELLPDKFTLNELQTVYEAILDDKMDNRNFRKKVMGKKYVIPLDEKQTGVSKRPSQLYMFSRDVYDVMCKKSSIIHI